MKAQDLVVMQPSEYFITCGGVRAADVYDSQFGQCTEALDGFGAWHAGIQPQLLYVWAALCKLVVCCISQPGAPVHEHPLHNPLPPLNLFQQ